MAVRGQLFNGDPCVLTASSLPLCPGKKKDTSEMDIPYQTNVTALVEGVKAAVQCSHLWVSLLHTWA